MERVEAAGELASDAQVATFDVDRVGTVRLRRVSCLLKFAVDVFVLDQVAGGHDS